MTYKKHTLALIESKQFNLTDDERRQRHADKEF